MSWRSNAGILIRQNGGGLVPALCMEACNEAATAGQQTPQSTLCTSKNFLFFVDQCTRCIKETIDTSPYGATPIPSLLPYLQDCHILGYTVKNVPVTNSKTSTVTFSLPTDAAAADPAPSSAPIAILVIFSLSFYLWKRHKQTKKQTDYDYDSTYGKSQLESDTNGIHELDSTPIRGEMPANEAPANEVPANEAPAVELQARHEA
ncbi:hypothetical protein ACHAPV_007898 [Trichoderma viride]